MRAPTAGLAVPRSTPQPVVCGQLPSSHSPRMGIAAAASLTTAASRVNSSTHSRLNAAVHATCTAPITTAHPNTVTPANKKED
uniref:Uncharacterized protein n=1 Tax=Oryza meridionalis TaxID=40149 RepID=A0A0E0D9B7_9ORYZ